MTGDDYDAPTAERYGWINRAVADGEIDGFVDRMAHRIASFDGAAVATAKALLARDSKVQAADLDETISALDAAAAATRERRAVLRKRAQRLGVDFELRLGYHLGPDGGR